MKDLDARIARLPRARLDRACDARARAVSAAYFEETTRAPDLRNVRHPPLLRRFVPAAVVSTAVLYLRWAIDAVIELYR